MTDNSYSVVVVTYNHSATLPACLTSVGSLDPAPARVIVVDNASDDGCLEIASRYANTLPLELISRSSNTGFAAAANAGIAAGDSAWILLLNPDCAPAPSYVERLLAGVGRQEDGDRVGCAVGKLLRSGDVRLLPTATIDSAGMVVTPSGRHLDRGAGSPDDGRFDADARIFGASGAAALYRRASLEDVAYPGGQVFPESFFAYREDAELAWRLQWRAWHTLYVPDAVAAHRRGFRPEEGRAGHTSVNRHSVRNRFLLRAHCADVAWLLAFLPWWVARDLVVVAACLTVERSSLPALGEAWRLRGDAAHRRRWVMARRTAPSRQVRRWFRTRGWTEEMQR